MTRLFAILAVALLLSPRPATAGELTLRDVIELHRSGLGEELLIAVIEADGGPFQLTYADILDLKSDGLGERIIAALVRTGTRRQVISGDVPVVSVQQVTHVTPTFIVVDPSPVVPDRPHQRAGDSDRGYTPAPGQIPRMVTPPPATWTTRRDDGVMVTPSGTRRSDKPAATWMTPGAGSPKQAEGNDDRRERRPRRNH